MKKEDILKEIILELKNPSDFSLNFITSRNGIQCYFSQKSLALFYNFSNIEYQNNNDYCRATCKFKSNQVTSFLL